MALRINLRNLERNPIDAVGEIPASELDLEGVDEVIRVEDPLVYDIEAQKLDDSVLVQGSLRLNLKCECVRCLKPFVYTVEVPDWACHLALEGDEKVEVTNDCIDLTPYMREDILLGFPRHPLCKPDCGGLPKQNIGKTRQNGSAGQNKSNSSAWAELNKLKI